MKCRRALPRLPARAGGRTANRGASLKIGAARRVATTKTPRIAPRIRGSSFVRDMLRGERRLRVADRHRSLAGIVDVLFQGDRRVFVPPTAMVRFTTARAARRKEDAHVRRQPSNANPG